MHRQSNRQVICKFMLRYIHEDTICMSQNEKKKTIPSNSFGHVAMTKSGMDTPTYGKTEP